MEKETNQPPNSNKKKAPAFLVYGLPIIILTILVICFSIWSYHKYASFTNGVLVAGNAEAWVFMSFFAGLVAFLAYLIYATIAYAFRSSSSLPEKHRRKVLATSMLGMLGVHAFVAKKTTLGLTHLLITLVAISIFIAGSITHNISLQFACILIIIVNEFSAIPEAAAIAKEMISQEEQSKKEPPQK